MRRVGLQPGAAKVGGEVTQSAVGRPRAGMLARDASDMAPNASALAARAVAENASRIRDGGMRPLQHTAAADNSISVVPLHSVAVIDKSMSVVVTTAGAGAHASAMKKKRRSRSASGEPRSAGRRLRTCAGLAGTRPGGVFVRPLLFRLQVIPKFCKTVITSESSIDQSRKRRKRLLTQKQPNMASGAPTIPASGIPVGADALVSATAEPSSAVRAAPTTGESPQAKRPSKRETAPSAPAATQDMTTAELTHAVQGILSQQDRDGRWMEVVRDVVEDHAKRLDDERSSKETDEHHHPGDSCTARGVVH